MKEEIKFSELIIFILNLKCLYFFVKESCAHKDSGKEILI